MRSICDKLVQSRSYNKLARVIYQEDEIQVTYQYLEFQRLLALRQPLASILGCFSYLGEDFIELELRSEKYSSALVT